MPERLTKIDGEIFAAEQRANDGATTEAERVALNALIGEHKKRRQEILEEIEKQKCDRVN